MNPPATILHRLAATIGLAAAIAAVAVPAAFAGTPSLVNDGRSPDTRDAARQARLALLDRTWLDTLDPAIAATIRDRQSTPTPINGRSPDTTDAALQAHSPVVTVTKPSGFAWSDFGIGVAAATGAFLLVSGLLIGLPAVRARRQIAHPAASA